MAEVAVAGADGDGAAVVATGGVDWKRANCSLRAVLGPASLGMMPARAGAVLISPLAVAVGVTILWPLPLASWSWLRLHRTPRTFGLLGQLCFRLRLDSVSEVVLRDLMSDCFSPPAFMAAGRC